MSLLGGRETEAVHAPGGQRILILGGGYVGLYTALRLKRKLHRGEAHVTVVDPRSYMTYQPFLPEAAAGSLEPRHVVVSLRRELRGMEVINGRVSAVSHGDRTVAVTPEVGDPVSLRYDHVVVALGSVARTLPVPGLKEFGIGFKQVEEAIALRNHVLDRLDVAASVDDPALRARALTFVFVGGGYAGTEAIAELEDMARAATSFHEGLSAHDLRFLLVEASGRILPEVREEMGVYTVEQLRSRGIDVRLETRLESCVDGEVVLSDGTTLSADTLVWTAGVKANPVLRDTDLPLDDRGRLRCTPTLQAVTDDGVLAGVWGAGDCAAVPDLTGPPGAMCSPSAQHAVRQARLLGDNLVAALRGAEPAEYRHRHVGSVASLGLHRGVADVYGVKVKGFPAWFMHRTYHMSRMPTFNRKVRIVLDWTLALFFRRELVALGRLQNPRAEFRSAAQDAPPPEDDRRG
ncbi:MAG: NADH dehydrogenase [uncultured Nocardioidaceae bacterium]|uniref:NADH dehydrogenase n=1 Tax=uncultured Nocardioidaceae bacterium TaxID=253824 RepID=A0A6J4LC24_9ACTN|nr:MAG: NADH dehydrogenase [uncultured Nocardioidaceae bacterium]